MDYSVISQKTDLFITTTVRTSNPTQKTGLEVISVAEKRGAESVKCVFKNWNDHGTVVFQHPVALSQVFFF
jgi:hypothetical protein